MECKHTEIESISVLWPHHGNIMLTTSETPIRQWAKQMQLVLYIHLLKEFVANLLVTFLEVKKKGIKL